MHFRTGAGRHRGGIYGSSSANLHNPDLMMLCPGREVKPYLLFLSASATGKILLVWLAVSLRIPDLVCLNSLLTKGGCGNPCEAPLLFHKILMPGALDAFTRQTRASGMVQEAGTVHCQAHL
jgi:hypothetical protein